MAQFIERAGSQFTLGYWAIRGLAQPIRFLLAYVQAPFSEVRLGVNQDGSLVEDESADWNAHRETLGVPFPNLPYLIDSSGGQEVRLTQSNAVLRYLARRFDLYGDAEADRVAIDVLQDEAYDFRNKITAAAYTLGDEYEAAFEEFETTAIPRHLDGLEHYLSERGATTYFVGSRRTLVDFVLYELLWQARLMVPGSIGASNRPSLHAFIEAFAEDPKIVAYMQSGDYIERPINSVWASFT